MKKIKKPRCPRCKDWLDYSPEQRIWRCLWMDCGYTQELTEQEKKENLVLISVFGE